MPRSTATGNAPDLFPETAGRRVRVLLPLPLGEAYDYRQPSDLELAPGDFVRVPLGPREVIGVVWDPPGPGHSAVPDARLKSVVEHLTGAPPLRASFRRFIAWVAGYCLAPPGAVLRMTLRAPEALKPPKPRLAYRLAGPAPKRQTAARARVLELLADGRPWSIAEAARAAGVGPGVVKGLVAAGTLEPIALPPEPPFQAPDPDRPGPALSPAQQAAASALRAAVAGGGFEVFLLEGVTGAGKTEVYLEAVAQALKDDRQVLVLLPEIALTAQWLERFEHRFGVRPAEWHSDLRATDRRQVWRAVAEGHARVVVGARSALFLPFAELGLIVVDEEHDGSYKQDEGVRYNARDMAVVRGSLDKLVVVLASATPALETVSNHRAGRYRRLELPDRHGGARLPAIESVDLRRHPPPPGRWLSPPLEALLEQTLAAGEQSLLFLNRRGYAPLTLCGACGHRLQCPNCTAWLVEHRYFKRLQCHHCGHMGRKPDACPACGVADALKPVGPGVERVVEEVTRLFPEARIATMTSDTVRGPAAAGRFVAAMAAAEIDILIGTQIVAKGHHFPLLTLVGVIDADLGLQGGDLRAAERTFQLLNQVAGRAGRAERPGRVLLQTHDPDHEVLAALVAGDRAAFIETELAARRDAAMPPFGRLAGVIVSGPDAGAAEAFAGLLGRTAPYVAQPDRRVQVLGPAPAPLAMIRGRHRFRLLMKTAREVNIQAALRAWLGAAKPPGGVRLAIDVDPYSFM